MRKAAPLDEAACAASGLPRGAGGNFRSRIARESGRREGNRLFFNGLYAYAEGVQTEGFIVAARTDLGKSNRHINVVAPVQAEELRAAYEIFAAAVKKVEAQIASPAFVLGLIDEDDVLSPLSDDPADAALCKVGDELIEAGQSEEGADALSGRAFGLYKIMDKLKRTELTPEILAVAATLTLPGGTSQFPTAEFLKALKRVGTV